LINLNTPGGLLEATRNIVQSMLASKVPIIVYVTPQGARAGSAGVFIVMAAHVAVMSPSTNIGAAHPVGIMGGDVKGDMAKKVENDAVAWARSIAEERGRNADWAESAVRSSEAITSNKAVEIGVIDFIAEDQAVLLKMLNGTVFNFRGKKISLNLAGVEVKEFPMTGRQKLVQWLSNPNLIYILLLFGLLGVFIEFQSPGLIIPGLAGGICLAIVFGVQILPINWIGVIFILAAAGLMIAEIFITSFGFLAAAGLTLLVIGSYLLFDVTGSNFFVEPVVIWLFSAFFAGIILAFGYLLIRIKRQGPTSNIDAMVGEIVKVTEAIKVDQPGKVLLQGSYWEASCQNSINIDEKVKVIKVDGTRVVVEKI
jgi:membrane-bound serine protease (ClpP class)